VIAKTKDFSVTFIIEVLVVGLLLIFVLASIFNIVDISRWWRNPDPAAPAVHADAEADIEDKLQLTFHPEQPADSSTPPAAARAPD
jgi:hypothetical protein